LAERRLLVVVVAQETGSPSPMREPLGLPSEAIERIARNAGAEDANCVRRVLRAYEHSNECRTRDAQLLEAAVRSFERRIRRESDIGEPFDRVGLA
jgi:hypothetical protein